MVKGRFIRFFLCFRHLEYKVGVCLPLLLFVLRIAEGNITFLVIILVDDFPWDIWNNSAGCWAYHNIKSDCDFMREIWSLSGIYCEYIVEENKTCILRSGNKCQIENSAKIAAHITVWQLWYHICDEFYISCSDSHILLLFVNKNGDVSVISYFIERICFYFLFFVHTCI
jgi:hypothetical protein